MDKWKPKLRASTSVLCGAVADLHGNAVAPSTLDAVSRLVRAATDMLQVQEAVNVFLETALQKESTWRRRAEERLRALEEAVREAVDSEEESGDVGPRELEFGDLENKSGDCGEEGADRGRERKWKNGYAEAAVAKSGWDMSERIEQPVTADSTKKRPYSAESHAQKAKAHVEMPLKRCRAIEPVQDKQPALLLRSIEFHAQGSKTSPGLNLKRVDASETVHVGQPSHSNKLPTLRDVRADAVNRRQEKARMIDNRLPPCDRCRLRKRSVMLREKGYISEEVFDRWAKKPGACLAYIHMDEPVDPRCRRGESQILQPEFEETETQSPG